MGIQVEFNLDLALRRHGSMGRLEEECVPEKLEIEKIYPFLKDGQRNYLFEGEIPLRITEGNQKLSRPIASVVILETTHFLSLGEMCTKGRYLVREVYDINDSAVYFEGMEKRK